MRSRSIFGKRTVPKHTKVSEETAEVLRRLARDCGKTESDFIATVIEIRCHGLNTVEKLQRARWEIVSGVSEQRRSASAGGDTKRSPSATGASGKHLKERRRSKR